MQKSNSLFTKSIHNIQRIEVVSLSKSTRNLEAPISENERDLSLDGSRRTGNQTRDIMGTQASLQCIDQQKEFLKRLQQLFQNYHEKKFSEPRGKSIVRGMLTHSILKITRLIICISFQVS